MDIFDRNLKYYAAPGWSIVGGIAMNGKPDQYTNFMHAFNTFLKLYNAEYAHGGFWAQDEFLRDDVQAAVIKFIELANDPDKITIKILSFIEKLKPAPEGWRDPRNFAYKESMTYFEDDKDEWGLSHRCLFAKILEVLDIESVQEYARREFKKAGVPYATINFIN